MGARIGGAGIGAAATLPAFAAEPKPPGIVRVTDYGTAGDGTRLDTKSIQNAIDACASHGGGTVYLPPGRFLSATLILRDRVTLHLENGAVLLGSNKLTDYPKRMPGMRSYTDNYTETSLIYAENVEQIGIEGRGVIDGQGASFEGPYKVRPYTIRVIECRNIAVTGITIQNSPMWVQHYLGCDRVLISGISVVSRVNRNNDGIDIDCCERVRISDCEVWSGDDAIVLKSTAGRPCKDVAITNCVISSDCNAFKLGTESNGGFENITLSNCTIYDTRLGGISLEMVDGGLLDRVAISNVAMKNVGAPVFIRLGNRARPFREGSERPGMGKLRNVTISNIEAIGGSRVGCAIAGLPGHAIENVTLENLRLGFTGGGTSQDFEREVPEHPDKYPEHNMFGTLPAYGVYCRHVRNIRLRNVETTYEGTDKRPALVCDDVEGLEIANASFRVDRESICACLNDTREALVQGCRVREEAAAFMRLSGARTDAVTLIANELAKARTAVEYASGTSEKAVFAAANHVA